MERWDLYDRDRLPTGEIHPRGTPVPEGRYHLVVHVVIFNHQGQMLIQQRQPFKEGWPNLWDLTVGGSAIAGDTSRTAAEREVLEEIGLAIDLSREQPKLTLPFHGGFDDIYTLVADVDRAALHLQESEVQSVRWASEADILDMLSDGRFIPYHRAFIQLLFALRNSQGVHVSQLGMAASSVPHGGIHPIQTKRLRIRPIQAADWPAIRAIWQDFARSPYAQYDKPHCTDPEDVRTRIARWAEATAQGMAHVFFVACLGDEVIGYMAFNQREKGYEVGYCFHSAHHGMGYAQEAFRAVLAHLSELGVTHFSAGTALNNIPSVRLLIALGFRLVGTEKVSFYRDAQGQDIAFDGGIFTLEQGRTP